MNSIKVIDIKNCTYYFFHDMIQIRNFDLNKIKTDEKSYKNILIYSLRFITLHAWRSKF